MILYPPPQSSLGGRYSSSRRVSFARAQYVGEDLESMHDADEHGDPIDIIVLYTPNEETVMDENCLAKVETPPHWCKQ